MITKTKKSVSLSNSLLMEMAPFAKGESVSEFIEKATSYYVNELKKQKRGQRDMQIINAHAKRFNKEAEENLKFQAMT
ncbi:MAG: hypothetical protein FWG99_00210 [Treponema sp.]|nr:hypothetical protein [Treponema sp.]